MAVAVTIEALFLPGEPATVYHLGAWEPARVVGLLWSGPDAELMYDVALLARHSRAFLQVENMRRPKMVPTVVGNDVRLVPA